MSCKTACICRCNQQGCGCHGTDKPKRKAPQPTCGLCLEPVKSRIVRSILGGTVLVTFCETCDRKRCKPCGTVERNPGAQVCTTCGVRYP